MNRTMRTTTIDTSLSNEVPGGGYAALQTTLYDLMQAMQDETGSDEQGLVVDAVMQLLRSGRIRFISQPVHSISTTRHQAFGVPA